MRWLIHLRIPVDKMEEGAPLLTMTKSRIIDEAPILSDEQSMLLETLSGLCAFYSAKDLSSFLFSDKFLPKHNKFSCFGYFEPLFFFGVNLKLFFSLFK